MNLKDARKKAGFSRSEHFVQAVYMKAGLDIAPSYAQKLGSLWETGVTLPPKDLQPVIFEVLGITEQTTSYFEDDFVVKFLLPFLMENGLGEEDAELISENKVLRQRIPKIIVESVTESCDKLRGTFE